MSEPTIYFPENVRFDLTFKPARLWNTNVTSSPSGRNERLKRWVRPKRQMRGTVYATLEHGVIFTFAGRTNDPGVVIPPTLTTRDLLGVQIMPFLDSIAGRYRNFYLFDPVARTIFSRQVGHWNGGGFPTMITWPDDVPVGLPFRGAREGLGSVDLGQVESLTFKLNGTGPPIIYEPPDFTLSNLGAHGQTVIEAVSPDLDPGVYSLIVSATDVHELVAAEMTTDMEDLSFDTEMEEPWKQVAFDLEESFG